MVSLVGGRRWEGGFHHDAWSKQGKVGGVDLERREDGLAAFIEGSACQDRSASLTCFNAFDFYIDLSVK